jgi:hypothetical protein
MTAQVTGIGDVKARAFYRSYVHNQNRSKLVLHLHIMREDGRFAGKQAECGTSGWGHRKSEPVVIDPMPATPPPGLSWCPPCVGRLAARMGRLDGWAAELAGQVVSDER